MVWETEVLSMAEYSAGIYSLYFEFVASTLNCQSLKKGSFPIRFESHTNLWIERDIFRGSFDGVSI